MRKIVFIILISIIINQQLPNDVRWVTNSLEYRSLCHQIYNQATKKLNSYPKHNTHSLNILDDNYAVVMDLDETVLNNSQYQVELSNERKSFTIESWAKWVEREEAGIIPGAYEYIQKVRNKNIQLIFISNRMHVRLEETKSNMDKLGLFSEDDIYLLRNDRKDKKTVRRNEIFTSTGRMEKYKKFTVIQYLGDAMGDFQFNNYNRFGIDQFIFPNPMYGKW